MNFYLEHVSQYPRFPIPLKRYQMICLMVFCGKAEVHMLGKLLHLFHLSLLTQLTVVCANHTTIVCDPWQEIHSSVSQGDCKENKQREDTGESFSNLQMIPKCRARNNLNIIQCSQKTKPKMYEYKQGY